jgi:predicted nucleic acid-binding protein
VPSLTNTYDLAAKVAPQIRSLDAVHLATALSIGVDLDFVTYDDRQAVAAREAGLRVVQPGR